MKLCRFFFVLFLLSLSKFNFIKAQNDDYSLETDDKDKVTKIGENYDIGVALPWLLAARYSLAIIPKQILVPTGETNYYVCRAFEKGSRIKIVGKLHYPTQVCIIPTTAKLDSIALSKLSTLPVEKRWSSFEVLTNPLNLNLMFVKTNARQGTSFSADDRVMPARPVFAEIPGTSCFAKCGKTYPPLFVGQVSYNNIPYMGVVQEASLNGTLAFYHGLLNVQEIDIIKVLTVLNPKKPVKFDLLNFVG